MATKKPPIIAWNLPVRVQVDVHELADSTRIERELVDNLFDFSVVRRNKHDSFTITCNGVSRIHLAYEIVNAPELREERNFALYSAAAKGKNKTQKK